ncbi:Alginate export [Abditibacterium utsteinense]|uniref:Alginate export n=1 Tax=Abditibacterium utsteinense TaxID=1960156 RepID=A0A2S8SRC5_9BACT|nr:alginate export family protein [Abditibacterium utsteinense]PQV63299.1 Alginate export [Abditibacterium utsteinense]
MNHFSFLPITFLCLTKVALAQTVAPATAPATPGQSVPAFAAIPKTLSPKTLSPKPLAKVAGFALSAQLRTRVENWNWFETPGFKDNDTFSGTQLRLNALKSGKRADFGLDLQEVFLSGVGTGTVAPAPQGALGFPGNYRAANGNQDGALSVKQGFVRWKEFAGRGSSVRLGRFEFNDGAETVSKDPTLNWLKQQRVSQRLIGTFGFSQVGRSFDGAQLVLNPAGGNFTAVAARPTEGVFQLNANDNIDSVRFAYGAYTKPFSAGEARLFGLIYKDARQAPQSVKSDNRPAAIRALDSEEIRIYTLGANFLKTLDTRAGKTDFLAWGALQGGDWGALNHKANAFALEAGYQPKTSRLHHWFRAGYFRSSGDSNPNDGTHGTFFSVLPTPRVYARFPFFNQMNSQDLFAQWMVRPSAKLALRAEAHKLNLTSGSDLWYSGGGAFQDNSFGVSGRPANGHRDLATLLDISADYALSAQTSVGLYLGQANGGQVISQSYPQGNNGHLAFVEISHKF